VQKVEFYRARAQECRVLARKMILPEHRDQLLTMAETWEALAADREALMQAHPELSDAERTSAESES
jgi:hypothetical protein